MESPMVCFLLIVLGSVQGERVKRSLCEDPDRSNVIEFNPVSQVCCDGTVYDVNGITDQNCCGKQLYDNLSHECCGREAIPMSMRQCCGGETSFNPVTHMCCGNNVYPKTSDFDTCCGNYPMDSLHSTCCPVSESSEMVYAPRRGPGGQCCGSDLTYDPELQICCRSDDGVLSEVLPRRNSNTACCGTSSYDTLLQVCCGESLSNKTSGRSECCGAASYDPTAELCCANTVYPNEHRKCCDDQVYHPNSASCCHGVLHDGIPEVSGVQGCCGQVSYLRTELMCCEGQLHQAHQELQCCGKDAYSSKTHLCCAGSIHLKSTPNDVCCGGMSYDASTQTCCTDGNQGDILFPVDGGRCCRTEEQGMMAYDPRKATCCAGRLNDVFYPDIPANTSTCCGHYLLQDTHLCNANARRPVKKTSLTDDRLCLSRNWRRTKSFNSHKQVCFHGMVRSKNQVSYGCGPYVLDPLAEMCCMGRIHPLQDNLGNQRLCCHRSIHSYVPRYQTCCSGRVDDIPAQISKCCRNRAYNAVSHTCDRNGIIRQTSEMSLLPLLCGMEPYNPSYNECCREILIGPHQTCCQGEVYETGVDKIGAGRCCGGDRGYNPDRALCCGDILHKNIKKGSTCCGSMTMTEADLSQVCCDGRLQSSVGGSRRDCSGGTAFNRITETVCDGVVYPQRNGVCCGKLMYNSSSEVCCGGNVYPRDNPHVTCCGSTPYDSTTSNQHCCNNILHYKQNDSVGCCGYQLIDPNSEHCCFSEQQNKTYVLKFLQGRTCQSLHSGSEYSMYTLCNGRMNPSSATGTCCGDIYIDTETSLCCGGNVMLKQYGENSVCCNGSLEDASATRC